MAAFNCENFQNTFKIFFSILIIGQILGGVDSVNFGTKSSGKYLKNSEELLHSHNLQSDATPVTFTSEAIKTCEVTDKEEISCPDNTEIFLKSLVRGHEAGSKACEAPASDCQEGAAMMNKAQACGDETCGLEFTEKYSAFCNTHQVCKILRANTLITSRSGDKNQSLQLCSDKAKEIQKFELKIEYECRFWCVYSDDWHPWSKCSKECDGGERTRKKVVKQFPHENVAQDKQCDETEATQSEKCNVEPCDCTVTDWGEWETCSKECGPGTKKRTRKVDVPGIKTCTKSLEETEPCELKPCEDDAKESNASHNDGVIVMLVALYILKNVLEQEISL